LEKTENGQVTKDGGWFGVNGVVPGQRNTTTINIMQGDQHFETDYCSSILNIQLLMSMSRSPSTLLTLTDISSPTGNNPQKA
jgi:hypothetical protein